MLELLNLYSFVAMNMIKILTFEVLWTKNLKSVLIAELNQIALKYWTVIKIMPTVEDMVISLLSYL